MTTDQTSRRLRLKVRRPMPGHGEDRIVCHGLRRISAHDTRLSKSRCDRPLLTAGRKVTIMCCANENKSARRASPCETQTLGTTRKQGAAEGLGWLTSGMTLALIPKCPACLAGYVAVATGIGLSMPAATYLRWGLIVSSVAVLVMLAGRRLRRIFRWSRDERATATVG